MSYESKTVQKVKMKLHHKVCFSSIKTSVSRSIKPFKHNVKKIKSTRTSKQRHLEVKLNKYLAKWFAKYILNLSNLLRIYIIYSTIKTKIPLNLTHTLIKVNFFIRPFFYYLAKHYNLPKKVEYRSVVSQNEITCILRYSIYFGRLIYSHWEYWVYYSVLFRMV